MHATKIPPILDTQFPKFFPNFLWSTVVLVSSLCSVLTILNVCHFYILFVIFQLPKNAPSSVTLQPAPGDTGKVSNVSIILFYYLWHFYVWRDSIIVILSIWFKMFFIFFLPFQPCGVDYELRVFLSDTTDEKEYKKYGKSFLFCL